MRDQKDYLFGGPLGAYELSDNAIMSAIASLIKYSKQQLLVMCHAQV